jgi:SAM-dependent methyltransferase
MLMNLTERVAPGFRPRLQKTIIRAVYQWLNSPKYLGDKTAFMNYGYAALDGAGRVEVPELTEEEEDRRLSIQLYAKVVEPVAIAGKDLLEVGCGPGGGCNFLQRAYAPRSATGMDLAPRAVASAARRYRRPGLGYLTADAERLPFPDGSFDVVVNVESSHCYPNPATFFAEAARVLRPGGSFLLCDLRLATDVDLMRNQLTATGLVIRQEEAITANVVRALELDSPRRQAVIDDTIPFPVRQMAKNFIGVKGSHVYEQFSTGGLAYLRFALQKP